MVESTHHCAACRRTAVARCFELNHLALCSECGSGFNVWKGCAAHSYKNGYNHEKKPHAKDKDENSRVTYEEYVASIDVADVEAKIKRVNSTHMKLEINPNLKEKGQVGRTKLEGFGRSASKRAARQHPTKDDRRKKSSGGLKSPPGF